VAAIPEPGSIALAASAIGFAALTRSRRRRSSEFA
jgi:hypothetical protein